MMNIILLGAPGSGKGTVSNLLVQKTKLVHISTGNLFRDAIQNEDELSVKIKNILNTGGLVSDEITNEVARKAIMDVLSQDKNFILDGYPRTKAQAEYLNTIVKVDKVFYLKIDDEALIKRITGRRVCLNCNSIYNIYFDPKPINLDECCKCHSLLVQRKDDNEETIKKRIEKFNDETSVLIDFYRKQNILVEINAFESPEQVYNQIISNLKK